MRDNPVAEKSKRFALRIVRLYRHLTETRKEFVLSKQVLRSGTSIGANVAEAEAAISKNEFLAKMYIAFKECVETLYWLELLADAEYMERKDFVSVHADCVELQRLLSSITKTAREHPE